MSKVVVWIGSAYRDLTAFPEDARREAGHELYEVQRGRQPRDWKPMRSVGPGVEEIRIRSGTEGTQHRVFYVARYQEAVYVLHAFQKTSQKTSRKDLETGRSRYREMLALRGKDG